MDTKERIAEKATEMFMRYGVHSVSMDDIASQLGMSKKTLYQCYADKEDLVSEVTCSFLDINRSQCIKEKKISENAVHELFLELDMMRELFANMNPSVLYDLEKYHPPVFKKINDYKYGFIYSLIKENLERGVQEELYRPEIDIETITRFRIESSTMVFNSEVFPNNRTELVKIEEEILYHYLYGLSTSKGQKLIKKYKQQRQKIIIQ